LATPSPILNLLNEYLRECGCESEKMELFGILRDLATEWALGNATEEEIAAEVEELSQSIAALRQRAGFATEIEKLKDDLMKAMRQEKALRIVRIARRRLRRTRGAPAERETLRLL